MVGGSGSCGSVNTSRPAEECTSTLNRFGQTTTRDGEYIGAVLAVGTLDG